MKRTKLADRRLPDYTRGEEIANMVTHIVGGAFGIAALVLCVTFSVLKRNWWGLAGSLIYGIFMVYLYTISSVYHGLIPEKPKKVMQVLDHCSIFAMILGSYAPILLTGIRQQNMTVFIVVTVLVIAGSAVCIVFTAIDFKKYQAVSMTGYFAIGWAALIILYPLYKAYGAVMIIWLIAGGVAYTLGIIFYALGTKKRYFHSIFHLFILLGSILQFVAIFKYCILL
ncbi:MAG: hemolysin III family protein [Ruminococcaceae bacterium]|nr:hemolysin III family protein [Oscillospiraceae bacterium]